MSQPERRPTLNLTVLPGKYAVCRLPAMAPLPAAGTTDRFFSVTRTRDELSVVCAEEEIPAGATAERGWRGLRVEGPLSFQLTGVLASLADPLAQAKISIFAISTFDTDYLFVRGVDLEPALACLRLAGHRVRGDAV